MAKQSPLTDFHRSNGAFFMERDDWLLPVHFGNPDVEYSAVRSTCAFMDLSHRGLLQVTGPDRLSFLQGMLSNDLRTLKPFDGQYATLLTQQGKVIADVRVLCSLNSFYLDFWENLKVRILEHLNRYLVADEVEIADRTDEYAIVSIQGPRSEGLLREVFASAELPSRLFQHAMLNVNGTAICVVRASHTGESGFDLIAPKANLSSLAERLTAGAGSASVSWVGEEAQNILRVEAGIPRYGVDFSDENLLLEVDIEDAVSYTKGCYLGQEVVERIRSRGHVNKKLCGLLIDGTDAAERGAPLYADDKAVGEITSSVISPRLQRPIALGYVHKDFWQPGTSLSLHRGDKIVPVTVTLKRFIASS